MTTPGIGNPYWYEWYVGLDQVIKMLNPDNGINYVIFQSDIYNTIDDVVVGYNDGYEEICYQVKHEIDSSNRVNLTFDKLLKQISYKDGTLKKSLIGAIADGWEKASESSNIRITPVLYTNRGLGIKNTNRTFNGVEYKAHPLGDFIHQVKQAVEGIDEIKSVKFEDDEINSQWEEFKSVLGLDANTVLEFVKLLEIRSNTLSLDAFELQMLNNLEKTFSCTTETARRLFNNLVSQLRIWTTTRREKQKIYIEDVYTALSINNDEEIGNHILPPPLPFFNSRKSFCDDLKRNITECGKPIAFISGEPGSGKTSIISYLQSQNNFFTARYHTFRPISPEQRFYDSDDGLCDPSSLWNDLLIQLRNYFKGALAQNNIPILNALCSVEKMRSEVLRLAELLYIKNKQKIFICIDGIDHAARSKKDVTFLSSLYLPEEIPNGVCIIIVGQPSELYPKYPVWLRNENNKVQEFKIPPLEIDDIKQLLLSKKTLWVNSQVEALSSAIFSKTKGNNLSVVFAIEETMCCKKVGEVLSVLDAKHITGDINQYYDHIWSHVENRINNMGLGIAFPSLVIASCIVLLNGRIDTAILSNAIKLVNLGNDDWNQLMEMLFPLIVPTKKHNQFSILNNDFRVFLMGIFETHKTKYQAVALELALYLKDCEGSLERSINLIPLLICARREDLIAEAFDTKFVIESLAERVSLKTLNNYACLAYSSACELKNWGLFHSVYLAITTLRQHYSYYEYYSRVYQSNDNSDIKRLQIEEIQVVPLQLKTVKNYYDTLYLIKRLLQEDDINSEKRARNIYELWLNNYTPLSFIQLLEDDKNKTLSAWEKNTIDNIMELWGNIAAQLGYPNMKIDSVSEYSKEEQTGIINYNDAYFKYFFDSGKHDDIPEILKAGAVSYKCLEEKLEEIFLKGLSQYFKEVLHILAEKSQNQNNQLMALVCLIEKYKININDIINNIKIDEPKYIMDDQSLNIVLWSVLYSYQNFIKETSIIIAHIFKLMENIEKKDKNYEYLKLLVRTGVIVGKSIGAYNSGESVFIMERGSLFRIIKAFFLTDIYRTYDFKSAFKILLKLVLHHVAIRDTVDVSFLTEVAEEHLFNHHHIGMFYKTIILDFLVYEKEFSVIKKYINQLYGEHGKSLFQTDNYIDSHNQFKNYGILVLPDLIDEIDAKIKWDVANYTGNRENALSSPFDYYQSISKINPKLWKTLGLELYKLSYIANIASGNEMSWSIKENLYKSACNCGFLDCWELSHIDADFCYQLDLIYNLIFDLVENVESEKDLLTLWNFSCGILSWYNSKDRIGIQNIYNTSEQVAKRLGLTDFANVLEKNTPSYYKIATLENTNVSLSSSFEDGWRKGFETIKEYLRGLSNDEIIIEINSLSFENKKSYIINFAWNILKDRNALSKEIVEKFLDIVIANLEEYEWEHHEYGRIIPDLICYVGDVAAWKLANKIKTSIINSNTYYIVCLNMHFLIKTVTDNTNFEILTQRFQSELITQNMWVTGINNIITDFDYFKPIHNVLPSPKSLEEFVFNILLEQCIINNIHRMEIASYGLYLLCRQHSCLFEFIAKSWECYTDLHKKTILLLAERWSQEIPEGFEHLIDNLGEEYTVTNYLNRKLQLYYINKNIYFQKDIDIPDIEYTAEPMHYRLPTDVSPLLSDSSLDFCAKRFLSFMSDFMDCPYEDNYDIVNWLNNNCTDDDLSENTDYFSRHGDGMERLNKRGAIASQILYGEEKQGRWNDVPLTLKAQCLLSTDDSWIITTPPEICEKSIWDIEKNLEKLLKENEYVKITQLLDTIVVDDIKNEELLLGSCIYYPISYNDGLVYERVAKVFSNFNFINNKEITPTLSSKSLLVYEDGLFEPMEEDIYYKGICLIRSIVGTGTSIYGNAFIYPSNFIKEHLSWYPSKNNPFEWIDSIGDTVMRFERKSYPFREAIQENYFRQPILCRWICNKTKINEYLNKNNLRIYIARKIEPMYKFSE